MLVVEVKGRDSQEDQTKREFLHEWVDAVNQHKGFGKWRGVRKPNCFPNVLYYLDDSVLQR